MHCACTSIAGPPLAGSRNMAQCGSLRQQALWPHLPIASLCLQLYYVTPLYSLALVLLLPAAHVSCSSRQQQLGVLQGQLEVTSAD